MSGEATEGGRSRLGYWLRATVSAAVLGIVLTRVSGGELWAVLSSARPGLLVLAFALSLSTHGAAAVRLAMFVRFTEHGARALDMLRVNLTAVFYTLVVPGGNLTAAVVRVAKMRPLEIPVVPATAALIRDRIDATLGMVLVGAGFLALDPGVGDNVPTLALVVVTGLTVVGALTVIESPVARGVDRVVDWIPFPFLEDTIQRFWDAVRRTGRGGAGHHLSAFTLSVAAHLLSTLAYLGLAHALGLDLSLVRIGWIRAGVLVVTMIPVSLGGVGLREAAFTLLLRPFGVPSETAVALSLLVFGVTILVFGLLGGLWDLKDSVARRRDGAEDPRR